MRKNTKGNQPEVATVRGFFVSIYTFKTDIRMDLTAFLS